MKPGFETAMQTLMEFFSLDQLVIVAKEADNETVFVRAMADPAEPVQAAGCKVIAEAVNKLLLEIKPQIAEAMTKAEG